MPGSYECTVCVVGFQKGALDDECVDVDECKPPNGGLDPCGGSTCSNEVGSFRCCQDSDRTSCCAEGYTIKGGNCEDIDECKQTNVRAPQPHIFNALNS